jgi:hypothetical protein
MSKDFAITTSELLGGIHLLRQGGLKNIPTLLGLENI